MSDHIEDKYPEHKKLDALNGKNNLIGDFIEWLGDNGYIICERSGYKVHDCYWPVTKPIEWYIAHYFQIDVDKLEAEKRQMLDEIREAAHRQHASP